MKYKILLAILIACSLTALPIPSTIVFAQSALIIGQSCTDTQTVYSWSTSSRTAWKVADAYAVPVGVTDPTNWDKAASFHHDVLAALPGNPNSDDYAHAVTSIWN